MCPGLADLFLCLGLASFLVLCSNWLHSFCVGLPSSPDLKAAREVANFLGTDHHEFTSTVQVRIDMVCKLFPYLGKCG
jgi:asparagine synthetase B (glutamine-hydrolysing)